MEKNSLHLDLTDNEDLKAQLAGYEPGDTVVLEMTVQVKSNDDDAFEASIENVFEVEDKEEPEDNESEDSEDEGEEEPKAPALVVMMGKKKKE
jgi:hypothetical protein